MALFLIQASILFISIFISMSGNHQYSAENNPYFGEIEEKWHEEALVLQDYSKEQMREHFAKWEKQYPTASMFWIDGNGTLVEEINVKEDLPSKWTPSFTAKFMKERYGGDPFTVIALIGKDDKNGMVVLEIPRESIQLPLQRVNNEYGHYLLIGTICIIFLFILISFLFFWNIRKRLLQLQQSMTTKDATGLPIQTEIRKDDEIGQLEQTFNEMIGELRESKQREQKEEQLRRELIANLSHDLRTPLTKIHSYTYSLKKSNPTEKESRALHAIEYSVDEMDRLIENLMSYTLLMANKYTSERKSVDVVRYTRERLASWYPIFEKEDFDINIQLAPFTNRHWVIDPTWFGRIIDNLLQNILRHAKSGQYIGIQTESTNQYDAIVIGDHGKGMKNESNEKGAGIGLSIVDMMIHGMDLKWEIDSSENGTTIKIIKEKSSACGK